MTGLGPNINKQCYFQQALNNYSNQITEDDNMYWHIDTIVRKSIILVYKNMALINVDVEK